MPDSFGISKSALVQVEKAGEDPASSKVPNSCVTLIYEAKVAESFRNVSVTWNKCLINYSLTITVESPFKENHSTCKIDLKAWQFWGKKGLKSFPVGEKRVDVFWDFRQAKFSNNPEPSSDYYVALVQEDEVVLVVGDMKKEAYKRTKKRPALEEAYLLCKKEYIYGKKVFSTKAILVNSNSNSGDGSMSKKEYEIVIELSCGIGEPELSISIDSYEVIHVMNLNWRFRGNENVKMRNNKGEEEVQVYWDVHDWLFGKNAGMGMGTGTGNGLFIFKAMEKWRFDEQHRTGLWFDQSPLDCSPPSFFHVIYAWKID
ncbi:hypothetical protein M5689_013982 [Euphorbia peplus]|nr:hypothetical protein M5689_013982 [Euphorbia peplus]